METVPMVVEMIGAITTSFLYFSPLPTVLAIMRNESAEGFSVVPYLATVLNSAMWVVYGAYNPITAYTYSAGIICEGSFTAIFYACSAQGVRRKIWWLLAVEALFLGLVLTIYFTGGGKSQMTIFLGIMCLITCVYMYASPCIMMKTMIETREANFLQFLPSLGGLLNGSYGIFSAWLRQDIYTLIANSIGTVLSAVQLIVFLYVKYKCIYEQDAIFYSEDEAAMGGAGGSVAGGAAGGSVVIKMAEAAGGSVVTELTGAGRSVATESAGAGGSMATEVAGAASGSVVIEMAGAANESVAIEAADGSEAIEVAYGSEVIEAADGSEVIEMAGAASESVVIEVVDGSEAIEVAYRSEAIEAMEAAGGSVPTEAADGSVATEEAGGVFEAVAEET